MRYDARIYTGPPSAGSIGAAARLNELGSVGSRQIADRDRLSSRLYTAVLAAPTPFPSGRPVWIEWRRLAHTEPDRFVAYPVLQKERVLRLHRRDGEFHPGVVLEALGAYERTGGLMVTGGQGWFLTQDGPTVYYTTDFHTYEDVAALRANLVGGATFAGARMVLGGGDEIFVSSDGRTWTSLPVPGAAEVYALAWDGIEVWAAAEGGTFRVDLESGAVTAVDANPTQGLSYRFMNFDVFRAQYNAGAYDLFERNGAPFRTINFTLSDIAGNWVVAEDGHYCTDNTGQVIRFDAAGEQVIGAVETRGRDAAWPQATFLIRDTVFATAFGQLAMAVGDELRLVYDFGQDVRAYPCLGGFTIARRDGLLYRVRRVQSG